ncbi:outer membrane protein assembly factor BamB family protein [Phytohabitans kaempferiae]|uniref:PQQ-binding-like beta-propeller repeat protein n=1 Tax=Phytohabitans kaempferiae TaxID=1620943 RepID=A0ABV6M945_9ACTN
MTVTGVIDLGEMRHGPEAVVPEPVRTSFRWRFTWALAGLAALVVTLGPAMPEPVGLTESTIPARLGDTAFAVGDRFYVVTSDRTELAGPRTITAYGLPDATRLWEAPLPLVGALRGVGATAGQMLISTQPELLEQVESLSIKEDTGQIMWRRRALFEGVTPVRGHVLLWTSPDGTPTASTGREVLEAVDPVTGAVRWSYRVPTGAWLSYRYVSQAPTHVVTLLPSGRVEVRDAEDGQVLTAADLLPARPPEVPASYVQFAGDLLLVRGGPTVTAYGLERLDRRWTATIDLATEYVAPTCGETLCVVSHIGGVRVVDPATGRVLWSDPARTFVRRAGDLLVAEVRGRDGLTDLSVLDPRTGQQLNELGQWALIAPPGDGDLLAMRTDLATSRAWLARIDPATGAVHFFGVVRSVAGDCEVRAGAVLCRRLNATIGVWRPVPESARKS